MGKNKQDMKRKSLSRLASHKTILAEMNVETQASLNEQ